MNKSGYGNNPTKQGELTAWRAQTDRQVRTWRQSDRARGTHSLESADGRTSQHGNNPTERGALTSWSTQTDGQVRTRKQRSKGHSPTGARTDGQVRTRKQSDRARGTHSLESTDETDKSGHGNYPTEQGALTNWRAQTDKIQD